MRLISWNVNGLRACEGKGFSDIFMQLDADCFCLQETKMQVTRATGTMPRRKAIAVRLYSPV